MFEIVCTTLPVVIYSFRVCQRSIQVWGGLRQVFGHHNQNSPPPKTLISENPFHRATMQVLILSTPTDWRPKSKREAALVHPFSMHITHDILLDCSLGVVFSIVTRQASGFKYSSPKEIVHACASTVDHDSISRKMFCKVSSNFVQLLQSISSTNPHSSESRLTATRGISRSQAQQEHSPRNDWLMS